MGGRSIRASQFFFPHHWWKGPRVNPLDTQSYHSLTPPFAVFKQANPQLLKQGRQASSCPRLHSYSGHSSVPGRRRWWWHCIDCSCSKLSLSLFHLSMVHKDVSIYIPWGKHPFSSRVSRRFSSSCKVRHLLLKDFLISILAYPAFLTFLLPSSPLNAGFPLPQAVLIWAPWSDLGQQSSNHANALCSLGSRRFPWGNASTYSYKEINFQISHFYLFLP